MHPYCKLKVFCTSFRENPTYRFTEITFSKITHPFLLIDIIQFSSVQSLSRVRLFATPWTAARQASLSITNPQSSLKLMSIESVIPSSHLFFCCPLFLLPPIPPSIRVFSNEPTLRMRWSKYCSFRTQVCITVSQLDHLLFMITSAANVYAKGNLGWRREGNHYFMFSRTRKITLNSTLLRWLSFFISLKWLFERLSLE